MYSKILVPLDGSPVAEVVLGHAEELARSLDSELTLFQAIPLTQGVYDELGREIVSTDATIASATAVANAYLTKISSRLKEKGAKSVKQEVRVGAPAESIIDYAHEIGATLIAMSTHGRSGVGRWVYGSVAEKVLRGATIPVLLVRATKSNTPH